MRIYSLNRLENIRDNTDIIMQRLLDLKPKKKTNKKNIIKKKANGTIAITEGDIQDVTEVAVDEEKEADAYEDDFH